MVLNRKTTLLVLGAFVIAGGVVLATGAFSQVEADRTMTIDTAGDGSALLGLEANTSDYAGLEDSSTGDEVALSFTDINVNATTRFNNSLNATNNGDASVNFYQRDGPSEVTFEDSSGNEIDSSNPVTINSGESETVDIVVTIDSSSANANPDTYNVTFVAERQS